MARTFGPLSGFHGEGYINTLLLKSYKQPIDEQNTQAQ